MNRKMVLLWALFLALTVFVGPALAQMGSAPLEVQTSGDIRYVSGGIGVIERAQMEAMATDYNVKLEFSAASGPYISGVEVVVKGAGGSELLSAVSDGPWFFLNMPAGNYVIVATFRGVTDTMKITAGKGLKKYNLYWRAPARRLPEGDEM